MGRSQKVYVVYGNSGDIMNWNKTKQICKRNCEIMLMFPEFVVMPWFLRSPV